MYKEWLVHPMMLHAKGYRPTYTNIFYFNDRQEFQSDMGEDQTNSISFLSKSWVEELAVCRKNERQPPRQPQLTNDGWKKEERGPTPASVRSLVVLTFSSAANSCFVSTFIEMLLVGRWMKAVTSGFSVNTPRDGNYIISRTYPSSGRRSRREVTQGEGYAWAVTRRPQGSDHISDVECC